MGETFEHFVCAPGERDKGLKGLRVEGLECKACCGAARTVQTGSWV